MRPAAAVAVAALVALLAPIGCDRGGGDVPPQDPMTLDSVPPTTRALPGEPQPPPGGFPAGAYVRTIAGAPAEHAVLEGRWRLVLDASGRFELTGRFATRGRYKVVGERVTFEHDEVCPDGQRGVYGWTADGPTLRFRVVDDPCGPSRQYHLAGDSWTRDASS